MINCSDSILLQKLMMPGIPKHAFAILALLLLVSGPVTVAASSDNNRVPLAQLQALGHDTSNSAQLRGKPLLLQFWASWCHSCSSIMFDLDALLQKYPGTDYLAVSVDDEPADALQYIEKHALYIKYNDRFFIDADKMLSTNLGVETIPTVILLDASGKEIVRRSGHLNSSDLLQLTVGMKSIQTRPDGETD